MMLRDIFEQQTMKFIIALLVGFFSMVPTRFIHGAELDAPLITKIDIMDQRVDFSRLDDEAYRSTFSFGDRLMQSFDTVLPFTGCPGSLDLPHDLNTLTFHFSYPEWKSQHRVRYSYLLSGRDDVWSEPTEEPSIELQDLAPGTYTLQIKARGQEGRWSAPTRFAITIGKPWWLTWWALAIAAVMVGVLIALVVRYWLQRNNEISELNQLLEAYHKNTSLTSSAITNADEQPGDGFLRLVNHTLESHLSDENFGIAELCELLNISRTQLHRKLKKLTGLSTSHYIRSLRLKVANELFHDPSLNVSEVAFAVGFSSAAYFSKVFKAQYGISPSEARDQIHNGD